MKKIIFMFLLLVVALTAISCGTQEEKTDAPSDKTEATEPVTTNEINIIILCGQSNAEGHTWWIEMKKKNPQLYKKYLKKEDSVLKMKFSCNGGTYKNDSYESVKFGLGFNKDRFGPEVGMNEAYEGTNLTRPTYILKYTMGASDLYSQWRSYSSGATGYLYDGMINFLFEEIGKLEEEGYIPYVKAVCWMQGEADSTNNSKTEKYETYLDNFIKDLNSDLSGYVEDDKILFVDAAISESSAWTNYLTINQMKANVASLDPEYRVYIDTIAMGLDFRKEPTSGADLFHYDSLSMVELGKAFMNAILEKNILK